MSTRPSRINKENARAVVSGIKKAPIKVVKKVVGAVKRANARANEKGMKRLQAEIDRNRSMYNENMYGPGLRKRK